MSGTGTRAMVDVQRVGAALAAVGSSFQTCLALLVSGHGGVLPLGAAGDATRGSSSARRTTARRRRRARVLGRRRTCGRVRLHLVTQQE